ncbi:MAG: sigma-54 dependent transcriptional regulator [Gemmatimonadota bacterium]|nr:sigma-54 dependent transcriptional regulator [Gemmatimonadota bacterium]
MTYSGYSPNTPATSARILCVDDDPLMGRALDSMLRAMGFTMRIADSAYAALSILRSEPVDLVLTDQQMPGLSGLDLLRMIREEGRDTPVILLTAFGSVEQAVTALHAGAAHYLTKPVDPEVLQRLIDNILEFQRARRDVADERRTKLHTGPASYLVGSGPAWQEMMRSIQRVSGTRATVLVEGESGTGKELVARALRDLSDRADQPFVTVNCAALPEGLIESTLFGHERGSFTGATTRSEGAFERADGGTLLLDEISEMRIDLQAKLLRVLQEQEFERVGGNTPVKVDVRVLATTNRRLEDCVRDGSFRADLYYRLNVLRIHVPPLRDRREDIPDLVRHFAARLAGQLDRPLEAIEPDALALLQAHDWPGNVRELQHAVERAMVHADGPRLRASAFRLSTGLATPSWPTAAPVASMPAIRRESAVAPSIPATVAPGTEVLILPGLDVSEAERQLILRALERTNNNRTAAAALLGMHARTLRRKLKEMNAGTPGEDDA